MRTQLLLLCMLLCLGACKESKKATVGSGGSDRTTEVPTELPKEPSKDQASGEVIDVSGDVTASRAGAKPRELKLHDKIFSDDTVTTGHDGSVAIFLKHNGAIHDIGDSQEITMRDSLAWNATTKTQGAFDSKTQYEGSSAAGADFGREAATDGSHVANKLVDPNVVGPVPKMNRRETVAGKHGPEQEEKPPGITELTWPPVPGQKTGETVIGDQAAQEPIAVPWPEAMPVDDKMTEGGFQLSGAGRDAGTALAADRQRAPVLTKRAFVQTLAVACQKEHKGWGQILVHITFADSKISSMVLRGSDSLSGTLHCLETRLSKTTKTLERGTITFSLLLSPLK